MPKAELKRYCELVAALKLGTTNKAGRRLSTKRTIDLLEEYGVETGHGLVRAARRPDAQHGERIPHARAPESGAPAQAAARRALPG